MKTLHERTPPAWADEVLRDPAQLLNDHLQCEMKAASTALMLISKNPEHPLLVQPLIQVSKEELEHYELIHRFIQERGYPSGPITPSPYMARMLERANQGPHRPFLDRLLLAALVEARSAERFRLLTERSQDREIARLFDDLVGQEAQHFNLYIDLAREYFPAKQVDKRFDVLSKIESEVLADMEPAFRLHSGWKGLEVCPSSKE